MQEVRAKFPDKLKPLFEPHRYKVAYGGRGGAKSWGFARAAIIQASDQPKRVVCAREVQRSIKDSVHKLLGDQIAALALGHLWEIQRDIIKRIDGKSEFIFVGLSDQTVESIKSLEGVDICFVDEAQAVSKRSWDILIPTIRKPGSEIWLSLNPELDTDETWTRFIQNSPPDTALMPIGYQDNPWFPAVLEQERLHAKATMAAVDYDNIWEGKCRAAVTGAIYADEITASVVAGRICDVPYDSSLKAHVVFDLGWNDAMTVGIVQKHQSSLRIIDYLEVTHKTLDWISAELKKKNLNWGTLYLPHDGAHGDFKTGKSAQQMLQEYGWTVEVIPVQPVETGIRTARMALPQTYFDKTKAARLVECLRRYKRGVVVSTGEPNRPVHDEYSHGADMYRYTATVADRLSNETWGGKLNYADLRVA